MNIIIANTQEFNPQIGGVERVSSVLANKLASAGHKVIFIACYKSPFGNKYTPAARQYFLPLNRNITCFDNVKYFERLVLEGKFDLIINQAANIPDFSALCIKVKEITNTKLISAIHINPDYRIKQLNIFDELSLIDWFNPLNIRRWLLYPYRRRKITNHERTLYSNVYTNSDATVLLSDKFYNDFIRISKIKDISKLYAIPNPLPFELLGNEEAIKDKVVLFVGRLDLGHKRPDRLLEIWKMIEETHLDWKLVFVGDGPDSHKIINKAHALKLKRISFEGFKDPVAYYKSAAIICMTSSIEGFGMVLAEAMSFGVVPVAYNTFASLTDIVKEGENGYIIEPLDKNEFAKKLSHLMDDVDLRNQISKRAMESSLRFQADHIVDKWQLLFADLDK